MKKNTVGKALASLALAFAIASTGTATALADTPGETGLVAGTPAQGSTLDAQASESYTGKYYTAYALVKNDGHVYRANANGSSIGEIWGDTITDASETLEKVSTLFIDANVTSLGNMRFKFYLGKQVLDRSLNLTGNALQMNLATVQKIVFKLNSAGKNACMTLPSGVFRNQALLDEVRNFDKTQITDIPANAFYGCEKLPSISLPASARTIGNSAFYNCQKLGRVAFGSNLTSIGDSAFKNCYLLGVESQPVILPANVASIGKYAFYGCQELKTLVIGNLDTTVAAGSSILGNSGIQNIYVYNKFLGNYLNNNSTKAWSSYRSKIHGFLEVGSIADQKYTGAAITPQVTATWMGSRIPENAYRVVYADNVNPGIAKVTVTGLGTYASAHNGYSCTASTTFAIAQAKTGSIGKASASSSKKSNTSVKSTGSTKATQNFTAKAKTKRAHKKTLKRHAVWFTPITVNGSIGKVTYKKTSGSSKLAINASTGVVKVAKGAKKGQHRMQVAITAHGNSAYASNTRTVTVKVTVR